LFLKDIVTPFVNYVSLSKNRILHSESKEKWRQHNNLLYNYVCCFKYTAQISEIPKDKTIPGKFQYCARFHGDFVKKHK
jgi:hypothetical protein